MGNFDDYTNQKTKLYLTDSMIANYCNLEGWPDQIKGPSDDIPDTVTHALQALEPLFHRQGLKVMNRLLTSETPYVVHYLSEDDFHRYDPENYQRFHGDAGLYSAFVVSVREALRRHDRPCSLKLLFPPAYEQWLAGRTHTDTLLQQWAMVNFQQYNAPTSQQQEQLIDYYAFDPVTHIEQCYGLKTDHAYYETARQAFLDRFTLEGLEEAETNCYPGTNSALAEQAANDFLDLSQFIFDDSHLEEAAPLYQDLEHQRLHELLQQQRSASRESEVLA